MSRSLQRTLPDPPRISRSSTHAAGASLLIPVPAPCGGTIILGEMTVSYLNGALGPIPRSFPPSRPFNSPFPRRTSGHFLVSVTVCASVLKHGQEPRIRSSASVDLLVETSLTGFLHSVPDRRIFGILFSFLQ